MQLPLPPHAIWKHFVALSAIPRASRNEAAAARYVMDFAARHSLQAFQDTAGNVLVRKSASPGCEQAPTVLLQSHLDMVAQKTPDSPHDFATDPLQLHCEEGWLSAHKTTLGADNGVGVAASLAVLENASLCHGPLAALFTVQEEIGLLGAAKVAPEFLEGDFLLNLDGDNPTELIIGCAGALDLCVHFEARLQNLPPEWACFECQISGLSGGHSGADIHRGRCNAVLALATALQAVQTAGATFRLSTLDGGDARNAIPRSAKARIACPSSQAASLRSLLAEAFSKLAKVHQYSDPELKWTLEPGPQSVAVLDLPSQECLLDFLVAAPSGVLRFSDLQPGIVESSLNLGIGTLSQEGRGQFHFLIRSCVESAKHNAGNALKALARRCGALVELRGDYPGWEPSNTSRLLPVLQDCVRELCAQEPTIAVVHGGLECGLLKAAQPRLDCLSYGPVIQNMHSPEERLNIASVTTFMSVLERGLAKLSELPRTPVS